jgi:glutathionylspermidine synthase
MDYAAAREEIYAPLRNEGLFTWDWLYGQEYALAVPRALGERELAELRAATEALGRVYAKTVAVVQAGPPALLAGLGIPAAAHEAVRLAVLPDAATLIGRFDFARTPAGWKMLELNSDTPGGIVEAFHVNGRVCAYHAAADPNAGLETLLPAAFAQAVGRYRALGCATDTVAFSALDWHAEDAGTARYLLKASGLAGAFVPLKDLRVEDDRLCAPAGDRLEPIDIWYRLHPLGLLADDRDHDGYPTGAHVLNLAARKRLALVNPPGALIAQSKALQALIWSLRETGGFFSAAEHDAIAAYMLPTYFENRFAGRSPHVAKPVLGREGGGITIRAADGGIIDRDREQYYWDQPMVYQQYQDLETAELPTLAGPRTGRLVWGSFLINGQPAAVVARLGGLITDDLAYFVPVRLAE